MGDFARAEGHFRHALALSEEIGAPPHLARASVDYARMLLGRGAAGDTDRARGLPSQAASIAEQVGMAGLLADISDLEARRTADGLC